MEPIKINELIDRCIQFFKDNRYTSNMISQYKSLWENGIIKYMSEHGADLYTPEIGKAFEKTSLFERTVSPQEREKVRSIQVLDDMLLLGKIRRCLLPPLVVPLEGEIGMAMEKLITHLTLLHQNQTTLNKQRFYLSLFLAHLTDNGIERLDQITEESIMSFIKLQPNKKQVVRYLRVLFFFWQEQAILTGHFMELVDSFNTHRNKPFTLVDEEEAHNKLEQIPNEPIAGGCVMTTLLSYLNLSASKIADLTLEEIDWDNNLIRIVQKKTHKTYTLPLLPEMVNNLIKFIYEINHAR